MGSSGTSNVYIHVIEDVISKVRDEFINNDGPGDGVLDELQGVIISPSLFDRLFRLILGFRQYLIRRTFCGVPELLVLLTLEILIREGLCFLKLLDL